MFAPALSHYSQNPESSSNVVYSFASFPLELIQYNYDLGDCYSSTITPLSLLPNIHTCCPRSNGFRVAICAMMYIKSFLTFGLPHCLFSQTTLIHIRNCKICNIRLACFCTCNLPTLLLLCLNIVNKHLTTSITKY